MRLDGPLRKLWVNRSHYVWAPHRCTLASWSQSRAVGCLRRGQIQTLRFVGDSHMATLFMQVKMALKWPMKKEFVKFLLNAWIQQL